MFDLYTTTLSANGRKVLAASLHLGLNPRVHTVNVYAGEGQTAEYLGINPLGTIPYLVDSTGLHLAESNAILVYLAEGHSDECLWSAEVTERAEILSWLFWESAHWQPTLISELSAAVGHRLLPQVVPSPEAPCDWSKAQLAAHLDRLDEHLEKRSFLVGSKLTIADLSVGGMTTYFKACEFPADRYPHLSAWIERLAANAAWQSTLNELWA